MAERRHQSRGQAAEQPSAYTGLFLHDAARRPVGQIAAQSAHRTRSAAHLSRKLREQNVFRMPCVFALGTDLTVPATRY